MDIDHKQEKYEREKSIMGALKYEAEQMPGTRWNRDELEAHFKNLGANGIMDDIDETGLVVDYAYLMGVFDDYGYIDIYYLEIPFGDKNIYITEVNVSED